MDEIKALADSIEREKIERARQMTPMEKFLAGPELFEQACALMRAGIRHQFPEADDEQVEAILAERLAIAQRHEAKSQVRHRND